MLNAERFIYNILLSVAITVSILLINNKTCLKGSLKIDKTKVLIENGSLMKVKSIAGAFCNIFVWLLKTGFTVYYIFVGIVFYLIENQILVFLLSGCLRQVLLYIIFLGTVFDLISKEDKLKIEQAKGMVKQEVVDQRQIDIDKERPGQSKSGTQQVQESQSQEPSRSQKQTDVVKESLNQSKSDRTVSQINTQPVQTIQSQEPSRSQPRQEPAFTSVEEQRKNSIPLFQGAGFKPFVKDPGKQERYEKYLALVKQGHKGKHLCLHVHLNVDMKSSS